jgi:hypothetical protein
MNWQELLMQVRKPISGAGVPAPSAPFAYTTGSSDIEVPKSAEASAPFAYGPGSIENALSSPVQTSAPFAYEIGYSGNASDRATDPDQDGENAFSGLGSVYAKDAKAPIQSALDVIGKYGVRLLQVEGVFTMAASASALGTPELREAIKLLHGDDVQVLDLQDPRVPERFRQITPARRTDAA